MYYSPLPMVLGGIASFIDDLLQPPGHGLDQVDSAIEL